MNRSALRQLPCQPDIIITQPHVSWRVVLVALSLLLVLPWLALAQTNLLTNPGFEAGSLIGWSSSYGTYSLDSSTTHSGFYAGKVNYGSAIAQTVTGLTPNTTYTCSGWLKVATAGQVVYLGANNYGGSSVSKAVNTSTYTQATISFTTGATNTSAFIFIYQSGAGAAYCDDLILLSTSGDTTGTQAKRISDLLERFGVNTFSKLNYNGYLWAWGGSQGSYDSATTARAINYITAGSGLTMNIREYHRDYAGSNPVTPSQKTWIREVNAATGSPFTIALAVNTSTADIPGMIALVQDSISSGINYVKWVEGINEPNNDFGSGTVPIGTTATVQASLYQQVHAITPNVPVMGPSLIFGLPNPETGLTNYMGSYRSQILANSDLNNIHIYPPKSPNSSDGSTRNGAMNDIAVAYNTVLPGKAAIDTEWHPTLYANIHRNDATYAAYWGPIYFLSAVLDFDRKASLWFALFDYNKDTMKCGLFATDDTTPYPVANAFRAFYKLTGDTGATKRTFTPDKLNVTITGLPAAPTNATLAGGRWALFQNSARTYFLVIWNEQNDLSTTTTPVTVRFNAHAMTKVEEFNITSGSLTAVQTLTSVSSMTVQLDTSVRLLRITY